MGTFIIDSEDGKIKDTQQILDTHKMSEGIDCVLDGSRGIYIPQDFCRIMYKHFEETNIKKEDLDTCLNGPDEEFYWEAWENILDNFKLVDSNGDTWNLFQDGDLFLVKEGVDFYGN